MAGQPATYAEQQRAHEERRAAIRTHHKQTGSYSETAKAFGISPQRVRQIVLGLKK